MKTRPALLYVVVLMIGLLATGIGHAQKDGGLRGALSGKDDPTKDRRPSQPPDKDKDEAAASRPLPVINSAPDPSRFDKRIAYLEGLTGETVKPVSGLEAAKQRIEELRRRANRLRANSDRRAAALAKALNAESKQLEDRWRGLLKAMNDGKKRTHFDWAAECSGVLGEPHRLELPEKSHAEEIDEILGLSPKPDDDEEEPDDAVDPLEPVATPKVEVPEPDFADLAKAFRENKKPEMMHPLTWARLRDRFEYDLAQLQLAAKAANKKLQARRQDELEPALAVLKQAQETYANLEKLGDEPGEGLRRHLAHRIDRAELEQLKLARKDLKQMAKERSGQKSDRSFVIRTDPLAPEKTLMDLARIMELDGGPGAPEPDAFDNIDPNGLPPLYPPGSDIIIDEKVHYGNLVKANIKLYEGALRDINRRKANAESLVKRREAQLLRQKAAELRRQDRLDGREGHPLNEARNRRALKQMRQELEASRPDHVEQLKARLDAEAEGVIKRLETEYKRRDVMQAAKKARQPKTEPKPTADANEP